MGPENAWGGMKSQKVYKMKHPSIVSFIPYEINSWLIE